MKKLFVVLLAVLLTFSVVCAQETETVTEINWEDIAPVVEAAELEGDFYDVAGLGIAMWIPVQLEETELTDEDIENGFLTFLFTEDAEEYVSVSALDGSGASLEEWKASFENDEDTTDVEYVLINGLPALSFTDTSIDTLNIAFTTDNGYLIMFSFFPASDEGFAQIAMIMAGSIQPYEE